MDYAIAVKDALKVGSGNEFEAYNFLKKGTNLRFANTPRSRIVALDDGDGIMDFFKKSYEH